MGVDVRTVCGGQNLGAGVLKGACVAKPGLRVPQEFLDSIRAFDDRPLGARVYFSTENRENSILLDLSKAAFCGGRMFL